MAHTNRGRVILGGLLTGLVINIIEFITHGVILRDAWNQALLMLGKFQGFPRGAMTVFIICGFLLGIGSIWIYAAIRPRYGAGAGTALRAGFMAWALAAFLPNLATYPMGFFPSRLIVISTVVSLVELLLGTLAGAWLYKEEELTPVARPAAAA